MHSEELRHHKKTTTRKRGPDSITDRQAQKHAHAHSHNVMCTRAMGEAHSSSLFFMIIFVYACILHLNGKCLIHKGMVKTVAQILSYTFIIYSHTKKNAVFLFLTQLLGRIAVDFARIGLFGQPRLSKLF